VLTTRLYKCLAAGAMLVALTSGAVKTGPDVGAKIPDFSLLDQNGTTQTLAKIAGAKGAMLVFFRSADW
jgi:hypothetical protein